MDEYWNRQELAEEMLKKLDKFMLQVMYSSVLWDLLQGEDRFQVYSLKRYKTNEQREFIDHYYILQRSKSAIERELLSR